VGKYDPSHNYFLEFAKLKWHSFLSLGLDQISGNAGAGSILRLSRPSAYNVNSLQHIFVCCIQIKVKGAVLICSFVASLVDTVLYFYTSQNRNIAISRIWNSTRSVLVLLFCLEFYPFMMFVFRLYPLS
jgi:hypothetical protein